MPSKPSHPDQAKHSGSTSARSTFVGVAFAVVVVAVLAFLVSESVLATVIVLADGALAAIVWGAAIGVGWWLVTGLGLSIAPLRWQITLAAGIGIGLMSGLVLLLGSVGLLQRWLWVVLLGLMVIAGVARAGLYASQRPRGSREAQGGTWRPVHLLWVLAAGFLAIGLLEATVPPGLTWGDEARGYDVLEYHFGGPKEYWLAGRVLPLPHNIYTYFPQNAEMLYLLAFVLRGGPFEGIELAQMLNASLAIWAVAAAWLAGRELGPSSGVVAGVLAATCPWLTYLSGVAYVENGLLFSGTLAMAVLVRLWRRQDEPIGTWLIVAGVLAGISCGFKYSAIAMVALPLALVVTWRPWPSGMDRSRGVALLASGGLLAFSPWVTRNTLCAGNPVFPLAHRVLGWRGGLWTEELAARWDRAHSAPPDQADVSGRVQAMVSSVFAQPKFGVGIFVAAGLGALVAIRRRRGLVGMCLLVLGVQLVVWAGLTHLLSRFAVPLIIPLVVLSAAAWPHEATSNWRSAGRIATVLIVLIGAGINLVYVGRLYYDHTRDPRGVKLPWFGAGMEVAKAEPVNRHTARTDTCVWMVGDARVFYVARPCFYHVVFSRNPLAEFARTDPTGEDLAAWFRERGVTHVYVNWAEIRRFRGPGNYGWPDSIDEGLFAELRRAGARRTHAEQDARTGTLFYEILEVPRL